MHCGPTNASTAPQCTIWQPCIISRAAVWNGGMDCFVIAETMDWKIQEFTPKTTPSFESRCMGDSTAAFQRQQLLSHTVVKQACSRWNRNLCGILIIWKRLRSSRSVCNHKQIWKTLVPLASQTDVWMWKSFVNPHWFVVCKERTRVYVKCLNFQTPLMEKIQNYFEITFAAGYYGQVDSHRESETGSRLVYHKCYPNYNAITDCAIHTCRYWIGLVWWSRICLFHHNIPKSICVHKLLSTLLFIPEYKQSFDMWSPFPVLTIVTNHTTS